jgi:hypothetical protein
VAIDVGVKPHPNTVDSSFYRIEAHVYVAARRPIAVQVAANILFGA